MESLSVSNDALLYNKKILKKRLHINDINNMKIY